MIKKILLFITVLLSLFACSGNKSGQTNKNSDTIDSSSEAPDSTEKVISETPMPKAADELFDDFFFNFAANKKLQFKRIVFPLTVNNGKDSIMMKKEHK